MTDHPHFGTTLATATSARGPLCVGIDPHAALLADWGLPDDPAGLERFSMTVVEALADRVAVLKPQSAFFERHGSRGAAVLERVVRAAREAGALVLLDVKRGDVDTTAAAYADAYLPPGAPLECDAITVSPYLGFGSLDPFLESAERYGRGVFVLALTSNKEGPQVQGAVADGGLTVAGTVLDEVRRRNDRRTPMGPIGVVVGATVREVTDDLDCGGPVLVPGMGAQGGTPADLVRIFGPLVGRVLPSTSRAVLAAGPDVVGLRRAAAAVADDLSRAGVVGA